MNIEEFKTKLVELEAKYVGDVQQLKKKYALSNNTVKLGDIVTDHMGSVLVTKISVNYSEVPSAVFHGRVLRRDLSPTKKESFRVVHSRAVHQHNPRVDI